MALWGGGLMCSVTMPQGVAIVHTPHVSVQLQEQQHALQNEKLYREVAAKSQRALLRWRF